MFSSLLGSSRSSRNSMASSQSSSSGKSSEPKRRLRLFRRRKDEQRAQSMDDSLPMPAFPESFRSQPPVYAPTPSLFLDRPEDVQEALARLRDSPYSASQRSLRTVPRVALLPSASSVALGSSSSYGSSHPYSHLPEEEDEEDLPPPSRPWSDGGHRSPRVLPPLPRAASSASLLTPSSSSSSHFSHASTPSRSSYGGFASPEPQDFLRPEERLALRRRYDDATLGMAPWEPRQGAGSYYFQ
ncbi:hypothetical protein CALVIDRAFT_567927 [Calocera viscosa TUFC12733]|uniref:Uncharacterized protein n=1 Tax=Calocera viscosa (strain TUFC12733) TaxID=1330018 RepID=A0A167HLN0_CALVF|nr:hypothetical protein CALVIDRAFT_567927 [Calocera viscosa TUFC12733]